MIIDCHGHYTTAPEAHNLWRKAQVAAYEGATSVPSYPTISDDEIVYEERKAKLYTFHYGKLKDGSVFPIAISTTRLETKFGDTAVAVHPSDERYKKFVGQKFDVDFCGTPITVTVAVSGAGEITAVSPAGWTTE